MKRVAVLGASHAGQALAGVLAAQGVAVNIYDHPDFEANIAGIREQGGIIELSDQMSGTGKVALATTDIRASLEGADVVMLIVPSFAQEIFLRLAAPHLHDDQVLLILPGNHASIVARKILAESGGPRHIRIAETNSVPLASRLNRPGSVSIYGTKKFIDFSAFPSAETDEVQRMLADCFPIALNPVKNVLDVAFRNFNMIVHCATAVMNTGWIETTSGNFDFYRDGISPSVCRVLEAIDRERVEICTRFDLENKPFLEWWREAYPPEEDYSTLYEIIHNSKIHTGKGASAPKSMQMRYVAEDVPYILVPLASFGRLAGFPARVIELIIGLASVLNNTDYWANGRNLETLGLAGLSTQEITEYLTVHVQ